MFEFDDETYQNLYDMVTALQDMSARVAELSEEILEDAPDDEDFEGTTDQEHLENTAGFLRDAASYLEDASRAVGDALGI